MGSVGVRELKQNASAVIERVRNGEVVDVTVRGERVARLTPIPKHETTYERLKAEGKIRPATGRLEDLPPPLKPRPGERPLSEVLQEMRDEDDR